MPKADLAQELEDINDIETPSEPSLLPRNDTDLQEEELIGKLKRLHVDPPQGRFFGKSRCESTVSSSLPRLKKAFSGYQLVQTALDIQSEYVGKVSQPRIMEGQRHDVDLPMECDDEFWELSDTSRAFKQPPDIPSSIAYFICYIKLMNILAYAMRALVLMTRLVRWDPTSKNKLFLQQSATLYATYYHLQIFVHRPFIPSFRNKSINTFPSLAICTNAARSCCHVLDIQSRTALPLPTLLITAFTSTVVLLLNIWRGKRLGVAPHPKREIDDVQRCLNILKACEATWYSAGRYRDILVNLAIAGDLTFSDGTSTTETTAGHKRPRDSYAKSPKQHHEAVGLHPIQTEIPSGPASFSVQPLSFDLPMYGNELGRLPVYGQFNFSESYKRPRRASGFQTFTSSRGLDETLSSIDSLSVPNSAIPQTTGYSEPRWGPKITRQNEVENVQSVETDEDLVVPPKKKRKRTKPSMRDGNTGVKAAEAAAERQRIILEAQARAADGTLSKSAKKKMREKTKKEKGAYVILMEVLV
ncbi:hypothetical protein C0989_010375 [Termitomyces sp. Mn162]|nr:hypothetical protein C0989_010375 [Termitomyces sp. Mn162]